jgi:hypothetical protein
MSAKDEQIAGGHYRTMAIQPFEFITLNGLGYGEGCVVKYVVRWRKKNGLEDLRKARHYLDLLIELEEKSQAEEREAVMHSGAAFKK